LEGTEACPTRVRRFVDIAKSALSQSFDIADVFRENPPEFARFGRRLPQAGRKAQTCPPIGALMRRAPRQADRARDHRSGRTARYHRYNSITINMTPVARVRKRC
jgi:hypothetical protein